MSMTDQLQAARVIYFRHKERGLVGNPDPMLAAVLALGEGDRRDAERYARLKAILLSDRGPDMPLTMAMLEEDPVEFDAAYMAPTTRPESP